FHSHAKPTFGQAHDPKARTPQAAARQVAHDADGMLSPSHFGERLTYNSRTIHPADAARRRSPRFPMTHDPIFPRSLLFVPGNKANMLTKALDVNADALVPDMEDSVPDAEKAAARETIRSFLPRLAAAGPLVIPRVNALGTPWIEADLDAAVDPRVFAISVGKVRTPDDVRAISRMIAALERRRGLPEGRI